MPKPYYQDKLCKCGCGNPVATNRRFVSGHNLKQYYKKTKSHCRKISAGQKKAWETKRQRMPIGSKNKDTHGYVRVKIKPGAGEWPKEHVLVMEKFLGRRLEKGEVVHHINGIRADNRLVIFGFAKIHLNI